MLSHPTSEAQPRLPFMPSAQALSLSDSHHFGDDRDRLERPQLFGVSGGVPDGEDRPVRQRVGAGLLAVGVGQRAVQFARALALRPKQPSY